MIYHPPVNAESLAKGAETYRTKKKYPKKPICVAPGCSVPVLRVRLRGGYTTCYSHDADDPKYVERRGRYASRSKYTGPLMDGSVKLWRLRTGAGLTTDEMGRQIGVSGSTVRAWERGKREMPVSAYRACERACEEEVG